MNRKVFRSHVVAAACMTGLVVTSWASGLKAADGDLDAGFGMAGQALFDRPDAFPLASAQLGDVAVLPDRRLLWIMEDGNGGATLMRLQADGSADLDFAQQGRLAIGDCVKAAPTRIVPDPDGSAVIWTGACLRRVTATGGFDPAFAVGASFPDVTTALGFKAADLLRDSQGRWLLAGLAHNQWQVYRFLADGRNDPDFGVAGVAMPVIAAPDVQQSLAAMVLRPDDRVVLTGSRQAGSQIRLVVFQLDADGQPDLAFGQQGLLEVAPPAGLQSLSGEALVLDPDGSIIVGGSGHNGLLSCCVLLLRVGEDGAPLPAALHLHTLGDNVSLSAFGETSTTLARLSDGRILLARNSFPPFDAVLNTRTQFILLRLLANGELDTSFGNGGWRSYLVRDPHPANAGGAYEQIHDMELRAGQVLMFGRTFFEDGVDVPSYATLLRVNLDALFLDGFER